MSKTKYRVFTYTRQLRNAILRVGGDFRTDLSKCSDYITSPEKVATHAFYPFIHYTIEFEKYSKDKGKKIKKREICYASHIDRCIYQYYNHLLDEMYIKRVHEIDISDSVVAYRSDLKKNNIHFSHDAFSFIKKMRRAIS